MKLDSYQKVLDYLYGSLPMFQRQGAAAFRKDLSRTKAFDDYLNHPHAFYKTIHIAGTNGKGSTAHMLAAVLQKAGYKTGLFTSPHLKDFSERIKIDGKSISQEKVVQFVNNHHAFIEELGPSFFEMTTLLAFQHFKDEKVDIAVIETGMGGRLDSSNVILPILSLITNVSMDHQQFLGDTITDISYEKAGIIKDGVPVVISEYQEETAGVFRGIASNCKASIYFAQDYLELGRISQSSYRVKFRNKIWFDKLKIDLIGSYQQMNLKGLLMAVQVLNHQGLGISDIALSEGLADVKEITGLKGRYQTISTNPRVICDVGHNEAGLAFITRQLLSEEYEDLIIVLGLVKDKDLEFIWKILPQNAEYIFTEADIPRALPAEDLYEMATANGLNGKVVKPVNKAYEMAINMAKENDLIFVGGSTFVVAELEDL